ncbi:MAG: glycogen synthase GlgA [Deltaproteobacteria bacterium]|nr:glycogen synthase GlgA [Deltaproteobacteria bacterium]
MTGNPIKVLFLSPEVVPFAKSGGLADVAGSLPLALKRMGMDVVLVMPYYRTIKDKHLKGRWVVKDLEVPFGNDRLQADVFMTSLAKGIPVYLIDREDLYDRPNLYGTPRGDYYDNLERFAFFAHASLCLMESIDFRPDIIHCHDWQSGLIPAILKGPYGRSKHFSRTATIFTIHNLGYQGLFPAQKLPITGLDYRNFFHADGLEFWGNMSLLKSGIVYADAVTTVSPTYSMEIQTSEYGMGMEGILQYRQEFLYGILNGIDYHQWDPAKDKHIPETYYPNRMKGKMKCKDALIQEMNMDASFKNKPLAGMISRLDNQKGLDLLVAILEKILALDMGLIILGAGDVKIQRAIRKTADHHPGRVGLYIGFNEPLAHRIMAGVDIFLIPSRYEPCGLTQMYALKYGTVPVARATGGLQDTIIPFDKSTGEGNGFLFGPHAAEAFLASIEQALECYKDPQTWKRIQSNGMQADFSWDRSAEMYTEVYQTVLKKRNILA